MRHEIHPTLVELSDAADGIADEAVLEHVAKCVSCLQKVQTAARNPIPPATHVPGNVRAASLSVPFYRAWQNEGRPEPKLGQVWRILWGEEGALALVWEAKDGQLRLLPVAVDVQLADEQTLVVSADRSPLGASIGIWVGLEIDATTALLDRAFGTLRPQDIEAIDAVRRSWERAALPTQGNVGTRPSSPLDPKACFRTELRHQFNRFRAASRWEPPQDTPTLHRVIREIAPELQIIKDRLGVNDREALDLVRGSRQPSDEELALLDELATERGHTQLPSQSAAPPISPPLVHEMNRPQYKPRILEYAEELQTHNETFIRRQLAYEAQEMLVAARRQRGEPEVDWASILDRILP